ncbi:MAG: glycosyltransferase family 4 protein [Sediminibacterium sp.]|jgi:glycosyltransferase involved in cell wall biosynthesis|nr:glycosyltransferase family 4 protein [Sediminibacterium sp.]
MPNFVCGPNSWLKRLLPELQSLAINVKVLIWRKGGINNCHFIDFISQSTIPYLIIEEGKNFYLEQYIFETVMLLKEENPDIFFPNFIVEALYAVPWIKNANIPVVGILHSDDLFHQTYINEFFIQNNNVKHDYAVCVSSFLAEYVKSKSSNLPVFHIDYGVNMPNHVATYDGQEPFKIVYVGRLENEQKRILDVTKAFCKLLKEHRNIEAYIYGSGSQKEGVLEIILNEARNLPLFYMGVLDSEKVQSTIARYHAFVLLSDYEGLPIAALEAMSCGLVPICMNMRSGINDLLVNERNGIIVNDRDVDFFSAVVLLRDHLEKWKAMSVNARQTVADRFDIKEIAKTWLELFVAIHSQAKPKSKIEKPLNFRLKLPPAIFGGSRSLMPPLTIIEKFKEVIKIILLKLTPN